MGTKILFAMAAAGFIACSEGGFGTLGDAASDSGPTGDHGGNGGGLGAAGEDGWGLDGPASDLGQVEQGLGAVMCLGPAAGAYCWNDLVANGVPRTLYNCPGPNRAPTSSRLCAESCIIAPQGQSDYCAARIPMRAADLAILQAAANYTANGYLRWAGAGATLSAAFTRSGAVDGTNGTKLADTGGSYWGECVSAIKSLSGRTARTVLWRPGAGVMNGGVAVGTALAVFPNGAYPQDGSGHTGFFGGYLPNGAGIRLLDQNWSRNGLMKMHDLRVGGAGLANPSAYKVVLAP